jgi:hypothetical protein
VRCSRGDFACLTSNPVIIFSNGIGDHILTLPTIRALSRIFRGRLDFLGQPGAAGIYYRGVHFARVIETVFRHLPDGSKTFDAAGAAQEIAGTPLLISLNPWHSEAMGSLLCDLRDTVTVGMNEAFRLRVPLDFALHSADLTFSIVRVLDPSARMQDFCRPLRFEPTAMRRAARLRSLFPTAARLLVVHSDTQRFKEWPILYIQTALNRFLQERPDYFALVVGMRDRGLVGRQIMSVLELPLAVSLAITAQADLFLGVDSCFLHMADLSRVPGVGLFGATNSAEWGFRFGPHEHIECGPSMSDDQTENVVSALLRLAN